MGTGGSGVALVGVRSLGRRGLGRETDRRGSQGGTAESRLPCPIGKENAKGERGLRGRDL